MPAEVGVEPDPRIGRTEQAVWFMDLAMPLFPLMHEITPWSAHEEIHLLAIDFSTMFFETFAHVPEWAAYYRAHDQTPHYRYLRVVLQALQHLQGSDRRWVLKSPQHIEQFGPLVEVFPDATFVVTHRDPVSIVTSMATMIAYTARMNVDAVDPALLGNYWADRIEVMLQACARDRDLLPADRSLDVRFDEFMADDLTMVRRIYELAGQPFDEPAEDRHGRVLGGHQRGRHGRIDYRARDVGLDEAELRPNGSRSTSTASCSQPTDHRRRPQIRHQAASRAPSADRRECRLGDMSRSSTRRAFLATMAGAALATACGASERRANTTDATAQATIPSTQTTTTAAPTTASFVDHGPTTTSQVALTFHTNGDLALVQRLYDITVQRGTPITCFIVGNWLDQHPDWAGKLVDAGHELANHTYSHPDSTSLGRQALASEITRCRDVLSRLSGQPGRFFRPSGVDDGTVAPSSLIMQTAFDSGYDTVLGFDVDPHDYQDPGAQRITQRVLDSVKAGSIVSLHFGHVGTVEALPTILDGLAAKNLRPVTASRLLDQTGGPD